MRSRQAVPLKVVERMPAPYGVTTPWRSIEFQAGVRPDPDEVRRRLQDGQLFEVDERGRDGREDTYRMRRYRMRQMLYGILDALGLEPARHHTKIWSKPWGFVTGRIYVYRGEPTPQAKLLWKKARGLAIAAEFPSEVTDDRILPRRIRSS